MKSKKERLNRSKEMKKIIISILITIILMFTIFYNLLINAKVTAEETQNNYIIINFDIIGQRLIYQIEKQKGLKGG